MSLSLFDLLLIAVDDQTELRTDQAKELFPQHAPQTVAAVLGKLAQLDWIERVAGRADLFRVSVGGTAHLDGVLESIRRSETSWPGRWFCVAVTVPASARTLRDKLRHYFLERGFGRLIDSLWISPRNHQTELESTLRSLAAGVPVISFETQPLGPATNRLLIQSSWDWNRYRERLMAFIDEGTPRVSGVAHLAREVGESNLSRRRLRLAAKEFVFDYARMLKAGPKLPPDLSPARQLEAAARRLYDQIRPYCYR